MLWDLNHLDGGRILRGHTGAVTAVRWLPDGRFLASAGDDGLIRVEVQGADEAVGAVVSRLVETSTVTADEIAAAVLEGMDRGDEVIVPDEAARMAWGLKQADRPAYDAVMRAQAAKLEEQS